MHERSLHVDAEDNAEPDQVDAKMRGGWSQQRNDNEGEFEEVEEESQHKHEGVDENQEAELSARQRRQQILDPDMAAHAVEGERKHTGAEQNEDHKSRQFGRGFDRLAHQVPGQAALEAT